MLSASGAVRVTAASREIRIDSRSALPAVCIPVPLQPGAEFQPDEYAAVLAGSILAAYQECPESLPFLGENLAPGELTDSVISSHLSDALLVMHRCLPYILSGVREMNAAELCVNFQAIRQDIAVLGTLPDPDSRLVPALVTAASRRTCYRMRYLLESDPANARAFAEVERCLFAVCLDTPQADEPAAAGVWNRWYGIPCLCIDDMRAAYFIPASGRAAHAVASGVLEKLFAAAPFAHVGDSSRPRFKRIPLRSLDLAGTAVSALAEIERAFQHQQKRKY